MASRYSVIQYVPDPIANERINIGVLAFDENVVRVQFLHRWDRVRHFAKGDIGFLLDFTQRMSESAESGLLFPGDKPDGSPKHERLAKLARGAMNSIQFTEPCGSLEDVDRLMEDIVHSCLVDLAPKKSNLRDRQAAARVATSKVRKVLKERIGEKARDYLRENHHLQGSHGEHEFDVVVANGSPYLAAHGVSFEVHLQKNLLDSLYWRIGDVKECTPELPLAIVSLPPKPEFDAYPQLERDYRETTKIFTALGAKVVDEEDIEDWVSQMLRHANV